MVKKAALISISLFLLVTPLISSADAFSDGTDQIRFLLTRAAAAEANYNPLTPHCVAAVSESTVNVHQDFLIAWGAWGLQDTAAAKNGWAPNGTEVIAMDSPGTYTFTFKFYGAGGVKTSCDTTFTVK